MKLRDIKNFFDKYITQDEDTKKVITTYEKKIAAIEPDNKTIVVITHDMDIVSKYAKRVVVLNEGKIVFDGRKEELFNDKDFDSFHLDYPSSMKLALDLKNKYNLDIKTNVFTLEELILELERI